MISKVIVTFFISIIFLLKIKYSNGQSDFQVQTSSYAHEITTLEPTDKRRFLLAAWLLGYNIKHKKKGRNGKKTRSTTQPSTTKTQTESSTEKSSNKQKFKILFEIMYQF